MTEVAHRSLAIISSNIRYDEPSDGDHCWKNRRDFLAERLLDFNPDLVATQEGKWSQLQDLASKLTGLSCADTHRQWEAKLMYPCLFYNSDTLTLQDSGDIWLSKLPAAPGSSSFGSLFPRLCTWARFDEGLLAVNVHLDHSNGQTRLRQIRVLLHQINKLRGDSALLLIGDFNESPACAVRSLINQELPELLDPWQELNQPEESSHHHFRANDEEGSRIDWILANNTLLVSQIVLDKSCSERGIYPSDHYILKARFTWPD